MTAPNQRVLFERSNAPQNVLWSVSDRAELHLQSEQAGGGCDAGEDTLVSLCLGYTILEKYSVIILLLLVC